MLKKILFSPSLFVVCLLFALPHALYGPFQDSKVYLEQAVFLWNEGLIAGIQYIHTVTGKFEPLFLFILWAQGGLPNFFNNAAEPFGFVLLNTGAANYLTAALYFVFVDNKRLNRMCLFVPFILLSYYVYSNNLYIWRSIYALFFFFLFLLSVGREKKIFLFIISVLFHNTVLLFYMAYIVSNSIFKISKNRLIFLCITVFCFFITIFAIEYLLNFISMFVVSIDAFNFYDDLARWEVLKRVLINGYLLTLLMFVPIKKIHKNYIKLYYFCIFLCWISMLCASSWQLSWRLSVPAFMLSSLFIFLMRNNIVLKMMYCLTSIPGLIFFHSLINGSFVSS